MTQDTIKFSEISDIAHDIWTNLELATRDNGEKFIRFEDSAPDWMREIARIAHDNEWPSDDMYRMFARIVEALATERHTDNDEEDIENARLNIVYPLVYTSDILNWLGDRNGRLYIVDEMMREHGLDSIFSAIQMAWEEEKDTMFDTVVKAIREFIAAKN